VIPGGTLAHFNYGQHYANLVAAEYDIALSASPPQISKIQEVTMDANPQWVWEMVITGQLVYRGFRVPSLYPGVEWTQEAMSQANAKPAQKP
jgi:hypothetical protein